MPTGEYGIGFLDKPRDDERSACEKERDHWLAEVTGALEYSFCENTLLTRQPQMRAASGLAAHGRAFTHAQKNRFSLPAHINGRINAAQGLTVDRNPRRMQNL